MSAAIWAGLVAFFKIFPDVYEKFKEAYAAWKAARVEAWLADGKALNQRLREAKTDDERRTLLRAIQAHESAKP